MPRNAHLFVCGLIVVCAGLAAVGQAPVMPPKLTVEHLEKLKIRESLVKDAVNLQSAGKLAEVRTVVEKILVIEREVHGVIHSDTAFSLAWLTQLCVRVEDFPAAREYGEKALTARKQIDGENHWRTTDARLNLADVEIRATLPKEKLADLGKVGPLMREVSRLLGSGEYAKAEPLFKEALRIRKAILGEKHPDYATSLNNLAFLYDSQGIYAQAEPLYKEALQIRKQVLGEKHPDYTNSLNNLASLYDSQSIYAKAEPLFKEALQIRKEILGEKHPTYANSLNNLASLYASQGLYAKAEPLYEEALNIRKAVLGEKHPDYAASLNNVALLYKYQGMYAKAEPLYKEARQIRKETLGEKHPDYANSLNNLATLYNSQHLFAKAEPLYKEALQIRKQVLGEKHPAYAASLNNLAFLYDSQGLYAEAEPLFKEALQILKEAFGEKHPEYANSLNNLALLYYSQSLYAKSEPLYKEALNIRKAVLGEKHPDYAASLNNLAFLYASQGMYAKAEPLYKEAIRIIEDHLEQTADVQSESGQLTYTAATRLYLNNILRLPGTDPAEVYAVAFRWRGAVTVRQSFARAARGNDPAVRQSVDELRIVSRKLSHLVTNVSKVGPGVDVPKLMKELSEERETLEKKLASQSTDLAKYLANRALTPADVQKRLPADAVLVDFLAYGDKIAAFVISQKTIVRVDLMGGKDLADLVENFRNPLNLNLKRPAPKEAAEKEDIRRVVWDPLVPHLKSAKLVLICPDGPLCRLPFAALRGTDPTKYLIEEVAIAVVLVPRLLPDLLADSATQVTGPPSLLLVGDVDFNINSGKPSGNVVRGGRGRWGSLPGTKIETEAIEALFRKQVTGGVVKSLSKGDATQAAIRQGAGNYRYLHIATHGEFLKQTVTLRPDVLGIDDSIVGRARASGVSAGVLCSLVFAGANKPTVDDPGVLSALEIAEMDLSKVELAVLSACETGLGDVASGEGVLGLQRAFQFAGTRTTVTSLWQIPDGATAPLMVRFYENRLKKGMPMLEALREAQLWVLNEGVKSGVLTEPLGEGRRTPPLFWAAFVLAGDWR